MVSHWDVLAMAASRLLDAASMNPVCVWIATDNQSCDSTLRVTDNGARFTFSPNPTFLPQETSRRRYSSVLTRPGPTKSGPAQCPLTPTAALGSFWERGAAAAPPPLGRNAVVSSVWELESNFEKDGRGHRGV